MEIIKSINSAVTSRVLNNNFDGVSSNHTLPTSDCAKVFYIDIQEIMDIGAATRVQSIIKSSLSSRYIQIENPSGEMSVGLDRSKSRNDNISLCLNPLSAEI